MYHINTPQLSTYGVTLESYGYIDKIYKMYSVTESPRIANIIMNTHRYFDVVCGLADDAYKQYLAHKYVNCSALFNAHDTHTIIGRACADLANAGCTPVTMDEIITAHATIYKYCLDYIRKQRA